MSSINAINNFFFKIIIIILNCNFFNKTGSCNLTIIIESIENNIIWYCLYSIQVQICIHMCNYVHHAIRLYYVL